MRTRDEVLTVEAINDRLRELESQQAASEPVAWDREAVARIIYDAMHDHVLGGTGITAPWVDGGNSHAQVLARRTADTIRQYAHPSAAAGVVTDTERLEWLASSRSVALFWDPGTNSHVTTIHDGENGARITKAATAKTIREAIDAAMGHPTTPTRGSDE